MPDPSPDSSRLLEPSNIAYEITVTTDNNVETGIEEAKDEESEYIAKKFGIGFWVSIGWLVLITGLAILAPWLTKPSGNTGGSAWQFIQEYATQNRGRRNASLSDRAPGSCWSTR